MLLKLASYRVPAASRNDFTSTIAPLITASKGEPGVEGYRGGFDLDEPEMFTITAIYRDEQAFESHMQANHFQQAMDAVSQMTDGRGVEFVSAGSVKFEESQANAESHVRSML